MAVTKIAEVVLSTSISAVPEIKKIFDKWDEEWENILCQVPKLISQNHDMVFATQNVLSNLEQFLMALQALAKACSLRQIELIKRDLKSGKQASLQDFLTLLTARCDDTRTLHSKTQTEIESVQEMCSDAMRECEAAIIKTVQKRKYVRGIGGAAASVGLAGAVATSVVAGLLTFGVGAIIGLSLTAAASGAAGIGATVGTAVEASTLTKAIGSMKDMSSTFDKLLSHLHTFHEALQECGVRSNHLGKEIYYLNMRDSQSVQSLCRDLTQLAKFCTDLQQTDALLNALSVVRSCRSKSR